MATVYITFRVMPDGVDTDLTVLEEKVKEKITGAGGNIAKFEHNPVAFGLKALDVTFSMDEDKGDTESLEGDVAGVEGAQSVQVTDVRRAIG